MPATFTTDLPDADLDYDDLVLHWTDTINNGSYRVQFRRTIHDAWMEALTSTSVVDTADSTTDWGSGSNATVSTVSDPSVDGTSIRGTTDSASTQGNRFITFTPGTNDDLSGDEYVQFWYQTDEIAGTHALKLVDGSGSTVTVSFQSDLDNDTDRLVQLDLSNFTSIDLTDVDQYQWVFDGDGSSVDKTIYVDVPIVGSATVPETQTTQTIEYLNGHRYDVRMRTETEHKTGNWVYLYGTSPDTLHYYDGTDWQTVHTLETL